MTTSCRLWTSTPHPTGPSFLLAIHVTPAITSQPVNTTGHWSNLSQGILAWYLLLLWRGPTRVGPSNLCTHEKILVNAASHFHWLVGKFWNFPLICIFYRFRNLKGIVFFKKNIVSFFSHISLATDVSNQGKNNNIVKVTHFDGLMDWSFSSIKEYWAQALLSLTATKTIQYHVTLILLNTVPWFICYISGIYRKKFYTRQSRISVMSKTIYPKNNWRFWYKNVKSDIVTIHKEISWNTTQKWCFLRAKTFNGTNGFK